MKKHTLILMVAHFYSANTTTNRIPTTSMLFLNLESERDCRDIPLDNLFTHTDAKV